MARIAGVNIPDNKHTVISLTYIYGIGRSQARRLCAETGVAERAKISELTEQEMDGKARKLLTHFDRNGFGYTLDRVTGALLVFCDEPQRHCNEVNAVLDERIKHVDQRIEELTRLARELKQLRGVCRAPGTAGDCRILNTLRSSPAQRPSVKKAAIKTFVSRTALMRSARKHPLPSAFPPPSPWRKPSSAPFGAGTPTGKD